MAHFPYFLGKKMFLKNLALSRTTSYGFLTPWQNLKQLIIQFQRNARTDWQTDGRTDPILQDPSVFHRGSNKKLCWILRYVLVSISLILNTPLQYSVTKSSDFICNFEHLLVYSTYLPSHVWSFLTFEKLHDKKMWKIVPAFMVRAPFGSNGLKEI